MSHISDGGRPVPPELLVDRDWEDWRRRRDEQAFHRFPAILDVGGRRQIMLGRSWCGIDYDNHVIPDMYGYWQIQAARRAGLFRCAACERWFKTSFGRPKGDFGLHWLSPEPPGPEEIEPAQDTWTALLPCVRCFRPPKAGQIICEQCENVLEDDPFEPYQSHLRREGDDVYHVFLGWPDRPDRPGEDLGRAMCGTTWDGHDVLPPSSPWFEEADLRAGRRNCSVCVVVIAGFVAAGRHLDELAMIDLPAAGPTRDAMRAGARDGRDRHDVKSFAPQASHLRPTSGADIHVFLGWPDRPDRPGEDLGVALCGARWSEDVQTAPMSVSGARADSGRGIRYCATCQDAAVTFMAAGRYLDDISPTDVPEIPPAPRPLPELPEPKPEPEPEPEDLEADQAAIGTGPPNRHRRVRKQTVAWGEVEYGPGAWHQQWSVTWHARTGGWTVYDSRSSEDGEGETAEDFSDIHAAVTYLAGEIEDHGRAMWDLSVRDLDRDDHVELRRFVARLRASLGAAGV